MLHLRHRGYRYELHIRLRVPVILVSICRGLDRCSKMFWQYPKGTGNTETSDKYTLILREVLTGTRARRSCLRLAASAK